MAGKVKKRMEKLKGSVDKISAPFKNMERQAKTLPSKSSAIDSHIKEISLGRGNGIPDNHFDKKKKK